MCLYKNCVILNLSLQKWWKYVILNNVTLQEMVEKYNFKLCDFTENGGNMQFCIRRFNRKWWNGVILNYKTIQKMVKPCKFKLFDCTENGGTMSF